MAEATEGTPEATEEAQPEAVEATEATEAEEPQAPDVGEALQQLDQRFANLEERLPAQEEPPDLLSALTRPLDPEEYEAEPEQAQAQPEAEGESTDEVDLRGLLGEAAQEALQPYLYQQDVKERTQGIQAYAAQHEAEFGNPEVVDAMAAQLEAAGLQPTDGRPPHPIHVQMAHKAYIADAAASGSENPAEAGGEGATLETGAGPGAPEPEVDPVEKMWLDAARGNQQRDAFS